jgi:hypothetical protein
MIEPNDGAVAQEQLPPFRALSFRMAFMPLFVVELGGGLAIGLLLILAQRAVNLFALICGIGAGELATSLWTLFLVRLFKIHLGPAGLVGFSFWGEYDQVGWQDIVRVRPFNFCGLRYLRVYSANRPRPLWLPLFLTDTHSFSEAVHAWAGLENPLAVALREAQDGPVSSNDR